MVLALFGSQHVEALAISVGTVAPSAMPTSLGTASLSFARSPGRQHALTLRGVEMSAGMWAGKKKKKEKKQILRLVQTYSCLYWSLGVTSEQGEYKHQQDPLRALKPTNTLLPLAARGAMSPSAAGRAA